MEQQAAEEACLAEEVRITEEAGKVEEARITEEARKVEEEQMKVKAERRNVRWLSTWLNTNRRRWRR